MLTDKTSLLYSLVLNCPFDLGCEECPFLELREISLTDRLKIIDRMDDKASDEMISKHYHNFRQNFDDEQPFGNVKNFNCLANLQNIST